MPIIKSAIKRMKQTAKRRERNIGTKRDIKSAVKAFEAKPTADSLASAYSEIETAVKKNILNKATAARRKSALSKTAKEAGVKLSTKKTVAKPAPAKKTTTAKKPVAAKKPTAAKKPAAKKPAAKKPATKK